MPEFERLSWRGRSALLRTRLRDNDAVWFTYYVLGRSAFRVSQFFDIRARSRALDRDLPGLNTREANRLLWSGYDWGAGGEEWTLSPKWRQAVIHEVMLANAPSNPVTLEIGPGGGRWSETLQKASKQLILVDVSERVLEVCAQRFDGADNVRYVHTDGRSLTGVADGEVDYVWSFDVFVHIAPVDQKSYVRELARVMRPGARGVIHHAGGGGTSGHWRSAMTSSAFAKMLRATGLQPLQQFERFGSDQRHPLPVEGDAVTVFER